MLLDSDQVAQQPLVKIALKACRLSPMEAYKLVGANLRSQLQYLPYLSSRVSSSSLSLSLIISLSLRLSLSMNISSHRVLEWRQKTYTCWGRPPLTHNGFAN